MDEPGGMYLQKAYIEIEKISLEAGENNTAAAAGKLLGGKTPVAALQSMKYRFVVPFNPSELQISSEGGTIRKKADLQKPGDSSPGDTYMYETVKPRQSLRVKLIFDETEGSRNGVTRQVEGFLAAVRSPASRNICFFWNRFAFCGSLDQVSAQYTMFSSQGIPLRAEITLSIKGT